MYGSVIASALRSCENGPAGFHPPYKATVSLGEAYTPVNLEGRWPRRSYQFPQTLTLALSWGGAKQFQKAANLVNEFDKTLKKLYFMYADAIELALKGLPVFARQCQ